MTQHNLVSTASFLAQTRLFGALSFNNLMILAAGAGHYQCPDGQVIFRKGDDGDTVYVIESGSVQVFLPQEDGPDIPLATLRPGTIFGELALFDTGPRSATVVAAEPLEAVIIRRSDFLAFLRKQPDAAIRILAVLAGRLRSTHEFVTGGTA